MPDGLERTGHQSLIQLLSINVTLPFVGIWNKLVLASNKRFLKIVFNMHAISSLNDLRLKTIVPQVIVAVSTCFRNANFPGYCDE